MRVPSPTTGTTNLPRQPEGYLRAATPDLSGLTRGLSALAGGLADWESKKKAEADQLARFKATEGFVEFNANAQARVNEMKQSALPEDLNFAERAVNSYTNYEDEFIATLPPDMQDEFRMRTASTRVAVADDATNFQKKNLQLYQKDSLTRMQDKANEDIDLNPDTMEGWKATVDEAIDNSAYSDVEKYYMKRENARFLEARGYKQTVKRQRISDAEYSSDLVGAATQAAADLGISPVDLLTVISYETGGKFSTSIKGGAGGRHIGLIQFGIPEAKKYGVHANQTPGEQMKSVVAYLKDRGFKPGMNILDLYSTINAGSPGRYNASDANNGGAPGTVADKVRTQMAGHKAKAIALLGGKYSIPDTIDEDQRFSNVPYEDRMNIRKDVGAELNSLYAEMEQQRKAEQSARMNELFNRLQSGDAGRAEYDRMVEDGMIPDYDDRKKALGIIEDRDKEGKARRAGQDRLRLGTTFDLTDNDQKKQLNAVFGEEGIEYMQRRDEEYVGNILAPLFKQAGGLPSDALGILKSQAISSNPADMMYALQTLSVLENINKSAYDAQIPKDLAAKSDFNELMETTLPLKDRIEMLTDAPTQEMRTRKKMLKEEANEMLTNSADPETAVKFDAVVKELGAPPNSQVAQVAEMEWNALFVEAYSKYGGNREAAIELATKQFTRVWKKSMQDGVEVFMKHPPEAYHAPVAGSNDWMRDQIRGTLGLAEGETYVMVSDRQTQIEVDQAQAKGEKPSPSWTVAVQRADGLWDIAREADGKPKRLKLKPTMYDMKAQELNLRVESKKIEMKAVMELLTPYGTSITGAPQEIQDRAAKVRSELDALLVAKDSAVQDATNAYKTPAAQEVERLQKKFDELQHIMYTDYYYKAGKKFSQAAEFAKVIDDLEAAKAKAEVELKAKRKAVTNESVDIFEGTQ